MSELTPSTSSSDDTAIGPATEEVRWPAPDTTPEEVYFTDMETRVINMLGQGIKPSIVAEACAVDPSYISQLSSRPEVADMIARQRAEKIENAVAVDDSIEAAEAMALQGVIEKLPTAKNLMEAAAVFKILNAAKKKADIIGNGGKDNGQQNVVQIIMPAAARGVSIQLNEQSQIIEVDGNTMVPMPSRALQNLRRTRAPTAALGTNVTAHVPNPPVTTPTPQQEADVKRALDLTKDFVTSIGGVRKVL